MSQAIEGEVYTDAVAGALGNKLYMCMKNEAGEFWTYSYDTEKNIWCKEDNMRATMFAYCSSLHDLFFRDEEGNMCNIYGTTSIGMNPVDHRYTRESDFQFSLTTAKLFLDNINRTYVNGLKLRVKLEPGTVIHIDVQYDGKEWNNVHNSDKCGEYVIAIPLLYRSCDYCKVRISGRGEFTLMGLSKTYSEGNDA